MESTLPIIEITVKPEPIEFENSEENEQNDFNEESGEVKEEELWIKAEPMEDDSQDSTKDEDQGTLSENEAKLDEEELSRNRQSNAPSRKQIMVFLDFLNEHRDLANCLLRGPSGRVRAHRLWEDIAKRLNNITGCYKTTHQWQRVWSDKKYLTRKAAAARWNAAVSGGTPVPELSPQDEKILAIIGEAIPPRRDGQKPATPEPHNNPEQDSQPNEGLTPEIEVPLQPSRPPRKPYTPRKPEFLRKEVLKKSEVSKPEVQSTVVASVVMRQPDVLKPVEILVDDDAPPSPSVTDPPEPAPTPPDLREDAAVPGYRSYPSYSDSGIKELHRARSAQFRITVDRVRTCTETLCRISGASDIKNKDLKSRLPLKKRLEKRVKQEDEVFPKQEKQEEKNEAEENEQQEDNTQPKMETPLMYSYETLRNIEIVTIDEEERQKEYEKTLKAREHMRHVCVHCAVGFVLKQAFDMHMKVHAPEAGDHECVLCHSRLKTADMLYKHRLRHYRRYRCLLCRMRFKDKDTAACHVMNDHTGQTFECDRCGRGFKRPQYLKKHVAQHHTKPHDLVCGICFRVFHERGWYRSHIRTHNEEVRAKTVCLPVTCKICSRDYKNKASLKRHLLTHDEDVHCEICFEKCKNRITLGKHYLKVHNEKYVGAPEQTCPHCDRICATRAMLKRHIQRMHSDRTKKYQCDYCQRFYLTKGEVRSHITWSHMPAEARGGHACTCGRIFRSPSLLRDHKARFHAAQPPPRVHQCDHCEKAFANKQVLNRHKKSHSNEMYPCNECGLLFKTQPYVKVHYQLKHLNMTRAQIKAQRKLNKEQIIQNNINKSTNWEPHIANKKNSEETVENEEDPLLVQEGVIEIPIPTKEEQENEFKIPTFQTFVDISRAEEA